MSKTLIPDSPDAAPFALGGLAGAVVVIPDEAERKAQGIHYTPPLLAAYLAEQVVAGLKSRARRLGPITVLDPACGDGELLKAVFEAVPEAWRDRLSLTGFDKNAQAVAAAKIVLSGLGAASVSLQCADFLSVVSQKDEQMSLLFAAASKGKCPLTAQFDAVISNPPYVRTQVLGAVAAQELAARFDLTGRVDLFHAFVKAMTVALREEGILGLLTSNRFLTVQSGSAMRDWLLENFHLVRLVDLGDTKLFEAAVLPAIVIGRRTASTPPQECEFIRVYESRAKADAGARKVDSVLEVLDGSFSGQARVNGASFEVETGRLLTADSRSPWS